ncbi:MAG: dGTP triphosphohydrolase [Gaiellaceae bacterium]
MPYDRFSVGRVLHERGRWNDERDEFARDRDRILYSSAFRRLAGKTQVAAAGEFGLYHNRLTHSLKVAQLGRRLAERLRDQSEASRRPPKPSSKPPARQRIAPPNPDLVEAACLAHDLGHPPFGHIGEQSLCETYDRLAAEANPRGSRLAVQRLGGFEGNAQTFRVLGFISIRFPYEPRRGLNLTRATLDAATKYPWLRVNGRKVEDKWGAFAADAALLEDVRGPHGTDVDGPLCFEAQLMDWCDDVTYAVHDVIDFYRGGFIPLDRLLNLAGPRTKRVLSSEASAFLDTVCAHNTKVNRTTAEGAWAALAKYSSFTEPWEPRVSTKAATQAVTSRLITYFVGGVYFEGRPCRHDGTMVVDTNKDEADTKELAVKLLKELLRHYVIDQPALATVQIGQAKIVTTLLEAFESDERLLPVDRREDLDKHGDRLRAATDHVASLTEADAIALYRRLTGSRLGSLTDAVL